MNPQSEKNLLSNSNAPQMVTITLRVYVVHLYCIKPETDYSIIKTAFRQKESKMVCVLKGVFLCTFIKTKCTTYVHLRRTLLFYGRTLNIYFLINNLHFPYGQFRCGLAAKNSYKLSQLTFYNYFIVALIWCTLIFSSA